MKTNRVEEYDIMKVYGILLVVIGHITRMYTNKGLISSIEESTEMAFISDLLYLFHMPLFVFISGGIYYYQYEILNKKQNFKNTLINKIKRLLIPYFAFGLLFLTPFMVLCGYRDDLLSYIFHGIILSYDCRHLWFVLMLFNTFILTYTLRKICNLFKVPELWMIPISFCIYLLSTHFPLCLQIQATAKYQFWFVLGYFYFCNKNLYSNISVVSGSLALLLLTTIAVGHYNLNVPLLRTICPFVVIILFYKCSSHSKKIVNNKLYIAISKNNFGIYLFHPIIIYVIYHYFSNLIINPYLFSILTFFLVTTLSILFTELVRKLHLHLIIGENAK